MQTSDPQITNLPTQMKCELASIYSEQDRSKERRKAVQRQMATSNKSQETMEFVVSGPPSFCRAAILSDKHIDSLI